MASSSLPSSAVFRTPTARDQIPAADVDLVHAGVKPATNTYIRGTDHLLWIGLWFLLVLILGVGVIAILGYAKELEHKQSFQHVTVKDGLQVGNSSSLTWFRSGIVPLSLETDPGKLPTSTPVVFSTNAPSLPNVQITLVQPSTAYTGLTASVSGVSRQGFRVLLDSVRTGTVDGSTQTVTLDRMQPLTTPVSAYWFAFVAQ